MSFPDVRLSRIRKGASLRNLLSEGALLPRHLVAPLFVKEEGCRSEIPSMPGIFQETLETVVNEAETLFDLGIQAVIVFGIPKQKDPCGKSAYQENGIIQKALRLLKKHFPDKVAIADCCLCAYTTHGECGLLSDGTLDHDATSRQLAKIAISYAKAGADIIAPSGMIDGMVLHIRQALNQESFSHIPILSYSVKFASSYYGPFRDAVESGFEGNRLSHQLNWSQRREAIREALFDVEEGADMLMVKPALPYLDILRDLRERSLLPLVAYQTSGEYAQIKAAAERGWLVEEDAALESLSSIKRAGADLIITYFAKALAEKL